MSKIIDLNEFIGEDHVKVVIGKEEYILPGDIDVVFIFNMFKKAQSKDPDEQMDIIGDVISMFEQMNPPEKVKKLKLTMPMIEALFKGLIDTQGNGLGEEKDR